MQRRTPEVIRFLRRSARQGCWPLLQRYVVFPRILNENGIECGKVSDFSVHVLVCEKDATMLHWCLRSLLHHSRTAFKLYIHDDGSCSADTLGRFRNNFLNAVVLSRDDASAVVEPRIAQFPELRKWRRQDYIAAKCIDFYLIGQEEWVIVLHADVLFLAEPRELFECSPVNLWMQE